MAAWGEVALAWALHGSEPAEGAALKWNAGDGCPNEAEVVAAVERYLGVAIAESSGADKRIAATAKKQRGGWVARVEVIEDGGSRERTLPAAPTCAEAAEAAALVIAISIDPEAVERTEAAREEEPKTVPAPKEEAVPAPKIEPAPKMEPAPKTEPEPEPAPAPKTEPLPPPKVATERVPPRERIELRGAIGVHGGIEFGALPGVAGLLGASAALLGPRFRVFVDANVLPQRRLELGTARADFRLWAIGVGGCPVIAVATQWSLAPCVAIEAGQVIAAPREGFVSQNRSAATWAAARASLRVQWRPARRVGLYAAPELVVPFVVPEFTATGGFEHQSTAAGVRGTLGVEVQFP